jgi:hypothetical protein
VLPLAIVVVAVAGVSVPTVIFPYKIHGGALSAAAQYRNGTPPARADYLRFPPGRHIGPADVGVIFGLYEVSPLPWDVETAADAGAALEASIRLLLVAMSILALIHASRWGLTLFLKALLLAGGWLTIELVWSLGTTNWGTASRHHIVGLPLLLIVSALAPEAIRRRSLGQPRSALRQPTAHQYGSPSLT